GVAVRILLQGAVRLPLRRTAADLHGNGDGLDQRAGVGLDLGGHVDIEAALALRHHGDLADGGLGVADAQGDVARLRGRKAHALRIEHAVAEAHRRLAAGRLDAEVDAHRLPDDGRADDVVVDGDGRAR